MADKGHRGVGERAVHVRDMYRTVLMCVRARGYLDQVSSLLSTTPVPPADAVATPGACWGLYYSDAYLYTPRIPNATEKRYLSCAPLSCIQFVPYAHAHPSEPLPKGDDTYNPSHSLGTQGNHIRLIVIGHNHIKRSWLLGTHGRCRATTDSTGHTQRPIISTLYIDCAEI